MTNQEFNAQIENANTLESLIVLFRKIKATKFLAQIRAKAERLATEQKYQKIKVSRAVANSLELSYSFQEKKDFTLKSRGVHKDFHGLIEHAFVIRSEKKHVEIMLKSK